MRPLLLAIAAALVTAAAAQAGDRDVGLGEGEAALHGALRTPAGFKRGPAVLMIAGSGPTNRDGNSAVPGVRPATLLLLADALEANGVPSLRFDKRGIAASRAAAPKESELSFDTLVGDAVAWSPRLAAEPGVTCVVLFGHSEGALIAALASVRTPSCGVISAAGEGRSFDETVMGQLIAGGAPAELVAKSKAVFAELKAGRTVSDIAPAPAALFRPSVQPYLISLLSADPERAIARAHGPVMILQDDHDLQISLDDARHLQAARADAQLIVVPEANHALKAAPMQRAANLAAYADPTTPLAPGVTEAVLAFVHRAGQR